MRANYNKIKREHRSHDYSGDGEVGYGMNDNEEHTLNLMDTLWNFMST